MTGDRLIGLLLFVAGVASLMAIVFWQRGMAGRHAELYAAEQEQERAAQAAEDRRIVDEMARRFFSEGAQ